jgi:chromosome partitioning protein
MKSLAVVSLKGGVGKTTLAVHFAFFIHETLKQKVTLVDGDPISSSIRWSKRGQGFPFEVLSLDATHGESDWLVLDTEAHPEPDDIEILARQVDRLVLPVSNIESLETAIEIQPLLGNTPRIAIVNLAPPFPQRDGQEMRLALLEAGVPVASTLVRRSKAYETAKLEGTSSYYSSNRLGRAVWFEFDAAAREVLADGR